MYDSHECVTNNCPVLHVCLGSCCSVLLMHLQLLIDITVDGSRYEGSLICPSCAQICYVSYNIVCFSSSVIVNYSKNSNNSRRFLASQILMHDLINSHIYFRKNGVVQNVEGSCKKLKFPPGQDGFSCAWLCFEFQPFSLEIQRNWWLQKASDALAWALVS